MCVGCSSYYYYSAPASCYYPVSYCPSRTYSYNEPAYYPPTTAPAAIAPVPLVKVNVTNTATAVNNSPGLATIPVGPVGPGGPGPMPGPAEVSPAPGGDR